MNLFVERIQRRSPEGARPDPSAPEGREIRVEAGKRAEYEVAPGARPVLYVLEGSVRFEGDDTPAEAGDAVWFRPCDSKGEKLLIGVEADAPFRGLLVTGSEARPGP